MLKEIELKRKQYNKVSRVLGDNNLVDYIPNESDGLKDTFFNIVRCENLINIAVPQSREDQLFNDLINNGRVVLGCV